MIGIAETPLGGLSSDVYVKLSQLQQLSDRNGRVNTIYVRAESSVRRDRSLVLRSKNTVDGASVTTAADLAERVSRHARRCQEPGVQTRGSALAIVALLAAFLIAACSPSRRSRSESVNSGH